MNEPHSNAETVTEDFAELIGNREKAGKAIAPPVTKVTLIAEDPSSEVIELVGQREKSAEPLPPIAPDRPDTSLTGD